MTDRNFKVLDFIGVIVAQNYFFGKKSLPSHARGGREPDDPRLQWQFDK